MSLKNEFKILREYCQKKRKREKSVSSTKTPTNDAVLTTGCHMTSQATFINRIPRSSLTQYVAKIYMRSFIARPITSQISLADNVFEQKQFPNSIVPF